MAKRKKKQQQRERKNRRQRHGTEEQEEKSPESNIDDEIKENDEKWEELESNVPVDSRLMFFLQLKHTRMKRLVQYLLPPGIPNMDVMGTGEFDWAYNQVKEFLESTMKDLDERRGEKDKYNKRVQLLKEIYYDTSQRHVLRTVRDLHKKVFERKVKVERHKDFPPETLLRVSLDFIPKGWLSLCDDKNLSPKYNEYMKEGSGGEVNSNRGTMSFVDYNSVVPMEKRSTGGFQLNNNKLQTDAFLSAIRGTIVEQAGVDSNQISTELSWSVGFLYTMEENVQDPHIDYTWSSIKDMKKRQNRMGMDKTIFPWSLDCPFDSGGLRLAFYGPEALEGHTSKESATILHCPLGKALLWRGDCVHAGSLYDLLGGGGLRMHAYLSLLGAQGAMSNTILPKIEWQNKNGTRYSKYKKKSGGEDYG